jgi:glycosyltransferase involved in cell wall biosynthesis
MNNKIKILLCSVSLEERGGVTNYVNLILKNYPEEKYQMNHFVEGYSSKFVKIFYPFIIFIQLLKFKETVKKFNPDIIHINPSLAWVAVIRDYIFTLYAKKKGFPVIFCVGGWDKSISRHFHKKNILSRFFYKIFSSPDILMVLANSFKDELIKLGIQPKKIQVTTMMVETEKFRPENRLFKPPYTLLFCSRIEKLKGIYQLLDAFQLILQKYPETRLFFVGHGTELKNLKNKVSDLKLEENIQCVGHKSGIEKIHFFTHADIMILPSFTEGFPNVFCEALAAGLPFIGTHVGGLVDVFQDRKQGLVIKTMPPDPQEIAEKIMNLMENNTLMKQMSDNNLLEAKEKYDVKVVMGKLDVLYQDIHDRIGKQV